MGTKSKQQTLSPVIHLILPPPPKQCTGMGEWGLQSVPNASSPPLLHTHSLPLPQQGVPPLECCPSNLIFKFCSNMGRPQAAAPPNTPAPAWAFFCFFLFVFFFVCLLAFSEEEFFFCLFVCFFFCFVSFCVCFLMSQPVTT